MKDFLVKYIWNKNAFKNAVRLTVWCSAVFIPKQCSFLPDAVDSSILASRKKRVPHFGRIKTALKPYGISECVLNEKVASRRYLSNGVSFESFRLAVCEKLAKNGRCHSSSGTPFSKLTKNRKESQNHFNIWKLRLVRSFPTAYHTSRFDKTLENWSKNSTENFKKIEKQSSAI